MKSRAGRIARFVLRWSIAVLGIAWVVANLHLRDRVLVLDDHNVPVERTLLASATESSPLYTVDIDGVSHEVPRDRVINGPDRKTVAVPGTGTPARQARLLGMRLMGDPADPNIEPAVLELLVDDNGAGRFIKPAEVIGGFDLQVPQPRVEEGILTMLHRANRILIIGAFAVMPLTYFSTTVRWHRLLRVLGIVMTLRRVLVLNMVGAFYNTFMPGSTGGDVLKAYYAAKHAPSRRTAAVMSVIIDRVLGLLTLIILGGAMAAVQYAIAEDRTSPVARSCLHVAIVAVFLLSATVIGLWLMYTPWLRRSLGISALLNRTGGLAEKLRKILEVMQIYRREPGLMLWAILITFPVHLTVVVSALLAGKAFGLPIGAGYYFIVVPVIVLAGAVPISPQGVGVMEAFAFYLTRPAGTTLNQALALTMSIRLVQIFWNLLGGIFVLRGGYHAPDEREKAELEAPASASICASPDVAPDTAPAT